MKTRLNTEKQRLEISYLLRRYRFEYKQNYVMPYYMQRYYDNICAFYHLGFISSSTFDRSYHMLREYKRRWKDGYYK